MPAELAEQLSIYDIAARTGYSAAAIHNAVARFGIKAEEITPGGVRYFSENIIPILKARMRKPAPQKK